MRRAPSVLDRMYATGLTCIARSTWPGGLTLGAALVQLARLLDADTQRSREALVNARALVIRRRPG